jgi:hypothetical protein
MFTLRKAFPDGSVSNTYLGDYYMTVRKASSPEKFGELMMTYLGNNDNVVADDDSLFGFIATRGYAEVHPLYDNFDYYIVNERGATFEREYKRSS